MSEYEYQQKTGPKRTSTLVAQPTFAEGPGNFLQALASKVQGSTLGGINSAVSEVPRIRTQLSSEVQSVHSRQETKIRQLDSQLALLQQRIRPQLQNIERQQGFTQSQIDDIRQKLQTLVSGDITPLQQKYEQLGMKFDRFMKVELENKLRPVTDDLRGSRAKLEGIKSNVTTSFQKVKENIEGLNSRIDQINGNIDNNKSKFDKRISDLTPKLNDIERNIRELQTTLDETPRIGMSFAALENLLKKTQDSVHNMQNEYIPSKIAESSAQFIERMGSLSMSCDTQLANIKTELDAIVASNQRAQSERNEIDANIEQLITQSFEIESSLTSIETETKQKIDNISRELDSNVSRIKNALQELSSNTNDAEQTQNRIDDSVDGLRNYIESELLALREEIKTHSSNNLKSQLSAYSQLSTVRNLLEGEGNLLGHLEAVERQIDWCISVIQKIDEERLEAQRIGADPQNIIARAKNIEERLTNALLRMKHIEETTGMESSKPKHDDEHKRSKKSRKDEENDEDEEHRRRKKSRRDTEADPDADDTNEEGHHKKRKKKSRRDTEADSDSNDGDNEEHHKRKKRKKRHDDYNE